MKIPILFGGLVSAPLGWILFSQYAATPMEPQKAIGYVIIFLLLCFVWAMVALLVRALMHFASRETKSGVFLLIPSLMGLGLSFALIGAVQYQEIRHRRLRESTAGDFLSQKASGALKHQDRKALVLIAGNANTPAVTLREISKYDDEIVLNELARNPSTLQGVLKELSSHRSYLVRATVLQNPKVGDDIIEEMTRSPDQLIQKAALEKARRR